VSNFSTPFANAAQRRVANVDEKANGFPCGPADQSLFNGLFHQIQKELDSVHQAAGIVGDDTSFNTTLLSIQALIDAATGAAAGEGYVLMSQARARNPVYPEIMTADFRINCSSPGAGTVRIPGGVSFLHRGIFIVETVETDFATTASKTYHIRWSYADGYALKDVSDVAYNPTTAAETSSIFDSTFDDMLIARVVTNSSNVATVTNLANANDLRVKDDLIGSVYELSGDNGAAFDFSKTVNFARTPDYIYSVVKQITDGSPVIDRDIALQTIDTETRYTFAKRIVNDYATAVTIRVLGVL
jgi:hypothetical protein